MEKTKHQLNIFVIAIFLGLSLAFLCLSIKSFVSSLDNIGELTSVDGQRVGRDFVYFYAAAKAVANNTVLDLYSGGLASEINSDVIPELGKSTIDKWPFLYPPHYLLLLAPLALFPYYYALSVWHLFSLFVAGFACYQCWKVRGVLWLITILNINVLICLIMGQNAVIFASLTAIGVAHIKKNPLIAGICFSIVSMKPHFAILIPLALIFGKYWRALLYTALGTLFLMLTSSAIFGWDIYLLAFRHLSVVTDHTLSSDNWFFSTYSTYRALLDLGWGKYYSSVGQVMVDILSIYHLQKIWGKNYPIEDKFLALGAAILLCSPYNLSYDSVWISLPACIYLSHLIKSDKNHSPIIFILLGLQIFAFAIISISHELSILLIISTLYLLMWLGKNKHEKSH